MASPDRFDGVEIDKHQARFAGTIELDPTDADRLGIDSQAMAIVVFRVGGATVDENTQGDLVRTNKFKLRQFAIVRDSKLQAELYDKLPSLVAPDPQLPFGADVEAPGNVDGDTGEILDDDEVFSPGAPDTARINVGGARANDATLRAFLEASAP